MENLIAKYNRLKKDYRNIYQRRIFQNLSSEHRIVGITGGRGVGKTTYLFHYLNTHYRDSDKALYVSADDLYFSNNSLIELIEQFIDRYDGEILCIDEIHRYANWAQELKNIYDLHHKRIKIIFSGSSATDLIRQKYDLSRRAVLKSLPGFSFREYIEWHTKKPLPVLSLEQVVAQGKHIEAITDTNKLLGHFQRYLQIGYYPIFTNFIENEAVFDALNGVIDKVISVDIADYYSLKTETLPIFKKILYFIFTTTPGAINVNKLANSLGKSNPDTARYIAMAQESGLVRYLLNDKNGHSLIRNAEKVFPDNTNLAFALMNATGKRVDQGSIRELFAITQLQSSGYNVFASSKGDIQVCSKKSNKEYIFEIGGKNKTKKQIKNVHNSYLLLDDIFLGTPRKIPLYLLGFLY